MNIEIHDAAADTKTMQTVKVPESEFIRYQGEVYVSREWIRREAAKAPPEETPAERLELVGPDKVVWHFEGGQRVAKLPKYPYRLLEFVSGQEGQWEHLSNINATVWGAVGEDEVNLKYINQTCKRVNTAFAEAGIPYRLRQKNLCIVLIREGEDSE